MSFLNRTTKDAKELTEADRAAAADRRRTLARHGIRKPLPPDAEYDEATERELDDLIRAANRRDDDLPAVTPQPPTWLN